LIWGRFLLKHIFIINPKAGKHDRTGKILAMAEALRQKHGLDCSCLLTQSPGNATELARNAAKTGEELRVYACGGDGTVHEVANGLAGYGNAAMTCIPVGTGNDFLKNFGADMDKFFDAENLWDGDVFPLDLIDCNGNYCLTIACAGIDARIADDVHTYSGVPLLSGRGSYLASVAVNFLFRDIAQRWTVSLDGVDCSGEYALCAVCNGRYYGGGSTPRPEARMNDGVLNTILVRNTTRLNFGRLFGDYSDGNFNKFPKLGVVSDAKVIRLRANTEFPVCLDGECFRAADVTFRLADRNVLFFGPKGCDCNRTAR
jgi:diacylglycerol kinase (ATP)